MNHELIRLLKDRLNEIGVELTAKRSQRDELSDAIEALEREDAGVRVLLPSNGTPALVDRELTPLFSFQVAAGSKPPAELILPDGSRWPLKFWKDILIGVARHLVGSGNIRGGSCPISKRKARKETLIAVGPPNPRTGYSEPVELGYGLWLETHGGAYELWEKACFLIEEFDHGSKGRYSLKP
jgi:hypothetical protein